MPASAPPHSAGTHMPMKPSSPISVSSSRGISPAASQARTCGATLSCAKARAVSRIRVCSSVRSMDRVPHWTAGLQARIMIMSGPGCPRSGLSLSSVAQQPRALALPVAVLDGLALVMRLLAGDQGDLDLGAAARVEIDLQWHDGAALALDGAYELVDLGAMQQELARPARLVIEPVARGVDRDVGIDQPGLAALFRHVGFSDRAAAAAQRFHLGAGQCEPGLEGLLDEVVVPRLAVLGHYRAVQLRFLCQCELLLVDQARMDHGVAHLLLGGVGAFDQRQAQLGAAL